MNPIGAISSISGVAGVSGIGSASSLSGVGGTSGITGASTINGSGAVDGTTAGQAPGSSFLNSLSDAFGQLNDQLTSADAAMSDFAAGGSADLHTVMLQMEEASIGLKTAVDVRDKLIEAYQDIMRTQV
jgi:flagellar hook-basal body complex protein FliE